MVKYSNAKPKSRNELISENIKRERLIKGLAAKELADRVGVQKSAISNYENATSVPRLDIIYKICEVLEVPISYILPPNGFGEDETKYNDKKIPAYDSIYDFIHFPDTILSYQAYPLDFNGKNPVYLPIPMYVLSDTFKDREVNIIFCTNAKIKIGKILILNLGGEGFFARVLSVNTETVGVCIFESEEKSRIAEIPLGDPCILGIEDITLLKDKISEL